MRIQEPVFFATSNAQARPATLTVWTPTTYWLTWPGD
jgi:hypothetical protein